MAVEAEQQRLHFGEEPVSALHHGWQLRVLDSSGAVPTPQVNEGANRSLQTPRALIDMSGALHWPIQTGGRGLRVPCTTPCEAVKNVGIKTIGRAREPAVEADGEEGRWGDRFRRKLEGPGQKQNAGAEGRVGSMGGVSS